MPGPRVMTGERLSLRTVEEEDVPFLQRGWTTPEIRQSAGMRVRDLDEMQNVLKAGTHLLVCLDGNDVGPGRPDEDAVERVGWLWVDDLHGGGDRPEIATFIVPECQGHGYAKKSTELCINYVFQVSEHPAVGGETLGHNTKAQHIMESIGFEEEGRLRKFTFSDGAYRDMVQYGLLRSEWRERGDR